jgi:hypothetical protein
LSTRANKAMAALEPIHDDIDTARLDALEDYSNTESDAAMPRLEQHLPQPLEEPSA